MGTTRCEECGERADVADTAVLERVPEHLRSPRYAHEPFESRAERIRVCVDCAAELEGEWCRAVGADLYSAGEAFRTR
jgi:hypothetical protein